jgi:hypothetical protein
LRTARFAAHKNPNSSQNSPIDPKLTSEEQP